MIIINWINDAYNGKTLLWKAFVFGYLIPVIPLTVLTQISKELFLINRYDITAFVIAVFVVFFYFWITIVMWKNSINTKNTISKILSRFFSVITAFSSMSLALATIQILS